MFPTDWCTPHLWSQISKEPVRARTPLTGEHRVDVAIIGGGFTGLSTAMSLAEAGLRTIVFESNAIGSAASGHNNGLIIPHRSKAASAEICAVLGTVRGSQRNDLVREAPHDAFALIRERQIRCDAVDRGWTQPAYSPGALARLRTVFEQRRAEGTDVEWLDAAAVDDRVGSRHLGGWQARDGGHINPFALAQGLARVVEAAGAIIAEGSRVTALRSDGSRWRLQAAGGGPRAGRAGFSRHQCPDRRDLAGARPGFDPGPDLSGRNRTATGGTASAHPCRQPRRVRHTARSSRLPLRRRRPDRPPAAR